MRTRNLVLIALGLGASIMLRRRGRLLGGFAAIATASIIEQLVEAVLSTDNATLPKPSLWAWLTTAKELPLPTSEASNA